MLAQTRYEHIALDDAQVPFIMGTTMKVVELVLAQIAYGWSPEELHLQFPHLTLGQIYSALAYYWDHQAELDQDIEIRKTSPPKGGLCDFVAAVSTAKKVRFGDIGHYADSASSSVSEGIRSSRQRKSSAA